MRRGADFAMVPGAMSTHVVLIRAIGGDTHKALTMRALEAACHEAGLSQVRNLLATGNLVVWDPRPAAKVAAVVRKILLGAGLDKEVFVRAGPVFAAYAAATPFPDVLHVRPQAIQLLALVARPDDSAIAALRARASVERVERLGDDIVIDYGAAITASRFTPVLVERLLARRSTARNWNTVRKIAAALG